MFSYIWSREKIVTDLIPTHNSKYKDENKLILYWREHCVECAAPECYQSCSLYESRKDGSCARFENGISPVKVSQNLGGVITFKRWAKLESQFPKLAYTQPKYIHLVLFIINLISNTFFRLVSLITKNAKFLSYHESFIERCIPVLQNLTKQKKCNAVSYSIYNYENSPLTGTLEIYSKTNVSYKNTIPLNPGWNVGLLDFQQQSSLVDSGFISFNLNNAKNVKLLIANLDVTYSEKLHINQLPKIKCVAWDLDNTLWEGIIGDDGEENVVVNANAVSLIKKFDSMGILNTIVSKNTFEVAWKKIEQIGISEYFLYPAINWGQKSQNLKQISEKLNIGIDTFALIDDSEFERTEVSTSLPKVRTYSNTEIDNLLGYEDFIIPFSIESKNRRKSYQSEILRQNISANYEGDYLDLLIQFETRLYLHSNFTDNVTERCLELLQRSNQYNFKTSRYDLNQFQELLNNDQVQCMALSVTDKFGNYGIVGFFCWAISNDQIEIYDLVLSCRVAQKRVEETLVLWLFKKYGVETVYGNIIKTKKNSPVVEVFKSIEGSANDETDEIFNFNISNQEKEPQLEVIEE